MSLRERDRTGKASREGKNGLKIGTLESDSPGFKSQPSQLAVVCRGRVYQTGSLPSLGSPSPSGPPGDDGLSSLKGLCTQPTARAL